MKTTTEKYEAIIDAILEVEELYPDGMPQVFRAAIDRARKDSLQS